MYISTKDWKNYIDKLSKLDKRASDAIIRYVQENGFGNRDRLISFANAVVQKYATGSSALAAAMYDATAEASGRFYDPAEPAPLPEYSEVAKTVNGTLKRSQNPNSLAGAVSRLVKKAGIDTTLQNAYRDRPKKYGKKRNTGAQVAWVPSGDTCPFCLMLASRGWMNQTVGGAENHKEHIHSNCDCTYAVRFDENSGVAGYDPDQYLEMFDKYEGSWEDKINAMRRDQYQDKEIHAKILSQKKNAYDVWKGSLSQRNINKKIPITDIAIEKVKRISIPGYSDEELDAIKKLNERILIEAKNNNNSNEVAIAMYNMIFSNPVRGDEKGVDIISDPDMSHLLRTSPLRTIVLSHNHPSGSYFSMDDIGVFVQYPSIKTMEVVTNQGKTWYITKNDNYDDVEVMRQYHKIVSDESNIGKTQGEMVEKFLKEVYNHVRKGG